MSLPEYSGGFLFLSPLITRRFAPNNLFFATNARMDIQMLFFATNARIFLGVPCALFSQELICQKLKRKKGRQVVEKNASDYMNLGLDASKVTLFVHSWQKFYCWLNGRNSRHSN
jgi:hypothetical protein